MVMIAEGLEFMDYLSGTGQGLVHDFARVPTPIGAIGKLMRTNSILTDGKLSVTAPHITGWHSSLSQANKTLRKFWGA
jgi:hypothetical protein